MILFLQVERKFCEGKHLIVIKKIPASVANSIEGDVIKKTKYYKQHLCSAIINTVLKKLIKKPQEEEFEQCH